MNTKKNKLVYYIVTGLFSASMSISIIMYFFAHGMAVEAFTNLGFPTFIIYPLAIAKLLGLIAIWTNKSKTLKEWAYAGFTFNLLLGVAAHINVNDGEFIPAAVALVLVTLSRWFNKKIQNA